MDGRRAWPRSDRRRAALLLAAGSAAVVLAGCGGTSPQRSASTAIASDASAAVDASAPTPTATTRYAAIADESLPPDRSYDTVMDSDHGLLTVTYNSGSNTKQTLVVNFLTDPTCVPGTRIWAVIDSAVSGAVQSGGSPYRVGGAYPQLLLSHCGVAETRFAGQYWAADRPLGGSNAPKGWDNP